MKKIYLSFLLLIAILSSGLARDQYPFDKNDLLLQGFSKKLDGREFDFPSHLRYANRAMIIRATDGQVMEWETETVPAVLKSGYVTFIWIAGESSSNYGKTPSRMDLFINGDKSFSFVAASESSWDKTNDQGCSLHFREMRIDPWGDRTGYMYLRIPAGLLRKGLPVTLKMQAEKAGSECWCMTFMSPLKSGLEYTVPSALMRVSDGKSREVVVHVNHVGLPQNAVIRLAGEERSVKLAMGMQDIRFMLPDSPKEKAYPLTLTVNNKLVGKVSVKVKPVSRKWQINFVQHAHTDIGYTRPQHEILADHIRYIDYALDYCDLTDNYPDDAKFRWTCETTWALSEYIRTRPKAQVERLKKRIKEGRIEPTAMYFNFDELPDEQTLAASLKPLNKIRRAGIPVELAMQNDVNGIGWCFSEFLPDMGIKYLMMGCNNTNAIDVFDKPTAFWWESPSGKKLLAYRGEIYILGSDMGLISNEFEKLEREIFNYTADMERRGYPLDLLSIQFSGYRTDNSAPSTAACEMVRRWNEKYEIPHLRLAVASEFMQDVEKNYADKLQTVRGAWPDWWTDGFASAAREAAVTRRAQTSLVANQAGLAFAFILGAELPGSVMSEIDEANKALLFYGEHTFGYYNSIGDPFGLHTIEQSSMKGSYAWESLRRSLPLAETALGLLHPYIKQDQKSASIVLFNPMNWAFSGQVTVLGDHQLMPREKKLRIVDESGREIYGQQTGSHADATYWSLWVEDVPALGSKTYRVIIEDADAPIYKRSSSLPDSVIENQWYKIVIDPHKGVITEWTDKECGLNLIDNQNEWMMGELVYETDVARAPLFGLPPCQFKRYAPENMHFEAFEEGPIWDTYRFRGTSPAGMGDNNLLVELQMFKVSKQIKLLYRLKKKEVVTPEAVYVSFPFRLPEGKIFFDVPGGNMEAGVDQIKGSANDWNTIQNFMSVRNKDLQIILASNEVSLAQLGGFNIGRRTAGALPLSNHIYSWPMSNYWFTNFNASQQGDFEWTYNLTSSKDNSIAYATQYSWSKRITPLARVIPPGNAAGQKDVSGSILDLYPCNLLVVNMAPVENEKAVVLHLREIGGKNADLSVGSKYIDCLDVEECDAIGLPKKNDGKIIFSPYEIKFIKIKWQ